MRQYIGEKDGDANLLENFLARYQKSLEELVLDKV